MQPTEPVSSPADPAADAPISPEPEASDSESASPSWWQRLLGVGRDEESTESNAEGTEESSEPEQRVLSEEELQRLVQSEADKRVAALNKAQRDAQRAEERRRLRDEDPWQYAEVERQAEQAQVQDQQLGQVFQDIGSQFDSVTLQPIYDALPPAEQQRIMAIEGAGVGMDGRRLVTTEALKALEKHWRAEGERNAEQKLRKNPAFRKQVLAETRTSGDEPDLLPAGSSQGEHNDDINNFFRRQVGLPTTR